MNDGDASIASTVGEIDAATGGGSGGLRPSCASNLFRSVMRVAITSERESNEIVRSNCVHAGASGTYAWALSLGLSNRAVERAGSMGGASSDRKWARDLAVRSSLRSSHCRSQAAWIGREPGTALRPEVPDLAGEVTICEVVRPWPQCDFVRTHSGSPV